MGGGLHDSPKELTALHSRHSGSIINRTRIAFLQQRRRRRTADGGRRTAQRAVVDEHGLVRHVAIRNGCGAVPDRGTHHGTNRM